MLRIRTLGSDSARRLIYGTRFSWNRNVRSDNVDSCGMSGDSASSSRRMDSNDEKVILVVGADAECKAQVADFIAQSLGVVERKKKIPVADGFRTFSKWKSFTRTSGPAIDVVDTVPFSKSYTGVQVFREVKKWISQNALRRMLGKQVCVVCVVSYSDAVAAEKDLSDPVNRAYNWLDFLGRFVFPKHKKSIFFVAVNKDDSLDPEESLIAKSRMRNFIRKHFLTTIDISYSNLRGSDSFKDIVHAAVKHVFPIENSEESVLGTGQMVPFQFRDLPLNEATNVGLVAPWVPERVILFGRSGSGKSTLAQMLTSGRLDPQSKFVASSSIRGETTKVSHGVGRGWYVVDTPGFGEAKGGSISSEDAVRKVKRYVQIIGGIYTHYIYVLKKDRIDKFDEVLWKFFDTLFGESIKGHFTVVVTAANKKWVKENKSHLMESFYGCESFLSADFPPTEDDEDWETELQEDRDKSLRKLEYGLTRLQRCDAWCDFGKWSKMTERDTVVEGIFDMNAMTDSQQKLVNAMRIGGFMAKARFHRLYNSLTSHELAGCLLLPEFD